jgi:hypothetical protein
MIFAAKVDLNEYLQAIKRSLVEIRQDLPQMMSSFI